MRTPPTQVPNNTTCISASRYLLEADHRPSSVSGTVPLVEAGWASHTQRRQPWRTVARVRHPGEESPVSCRSARGLHEAVCMSCKHIHKPGTGTEKSPSNPAADTVIGPDAATPSIEPQPIPDPILILPQAAMHCFKQARLEMDACRCCWLLCGALAGPAAH